MADFCARTMGTMEELSTDDDTASDTGAKGHKDHVLAACAAALPVFAQSSNIGIITSLYRETGESGQGISNVEYAPTQVDALVDNPLTINGTGNTNAQTQNGLRCNIALAQIILHRSCDVRQDLCAIVGGNSGNFPLIQHRSVFVEIGQFYSCSAQINTKTISHKTLSLYFLS